MLIFMRNSHKLYLGGDIMPDFEEMYYTLMRASEEALRIMIEAQKECEEMYIAQEESE